MGSVWFKLGSFLCCFSYILISYYCFTYIYRERERGSYNFRRSYLSGVRCVC
jgi:hypothetical protein